MPGGSTGGAGRMVMGTAPEPVAPADFVFAMNHFTSGVAVVTALGEPGHVGATVAAIAPIASDPPTVMVSLSATSGTARAVERAGTFAINVLDDDSATVAGQFATRGADKFGGLEVGADVHGNAVLTQAVAVLSCRVLDVVEVGSHREFRARVVDVDVRGGSPLAYYRGGFARVQTEADVALTRAIRAHVLSVRTEETRPLDVDALAEQLASPRGDVLRALSGLRKEALVERRDGRYTVASVSEDLVDRTYQAKLAIEVGVAVQIIDTVSDDQVAALRARLALLRQLLPGAQSAGAESGGAEEYVAALNDLGEAFVELAGSRPLLHAYHALGLPGIDNRTITRGMVDHIPAGGGFEAVVDGLAQRDLVAVLDALRSPSRTPACVRAAGRRGRPAHA